MKNQLKFFNLKKIIPILHFTATKKQLALIKNELKAAVAAPNFLVLYFFLLFVDQVVTNQQDLFTKVVPKT
jgi:hypothetical protein